MKNILRTLALSLIMLASSLSISANANDLPGDKAPTAQQQQRLLEIEARVNQIKEIDKSNLTTAEKKELRNELKALKKEARLGGGVYLSAGAIIIIVLLLVILL